MRPIAKTVAGAVVALALMTSSTAVLAQSSQVAPQQPQSPWMALSMMSPVGATALGSAGVAAQAEPGSERANGNGIENLPLPVLAIALATLVAMVYIALHDDKDPRPTESPD
jgi:hypothetical protein